MDLKNPLKFTCFMQPQRADELLLDYGMHRISCRYSPSLAVFHPSSPNWLPVYDVVAPVIRDYPEVKDLPWLRFAVNENLFEHVPGDGLVADVDYQDIRLEGYVDILCCSLRLGSLLFTLLFDVHEKTTAAALGRWMVHGYIPTLLQHDEHIRFVRLPLDSRAGALIRQAGRNPGGFDSTRLSTALNILSQWAPLPPAAAPKPCMLMVVVPSVYVVEAIYLIEDAPIDEAVRSAWPKPATCSATRRKGVLAAVLPLKPPVQCHRMP